MELIELKMNLHEKVKDLSKRDLEDALRKALLDCNIAITLAGGRGLIAQAKLAEGERGFEIDKKHYTQKELEADFELKVLFDYFSLFQEWFEEVKAA